MRLQAALLLTTALLFVQAGALPKDLHDVAGDSASVHALVERDVQDVSALAVVDKNQVLSLHNAARARYGARPLTWSTALEPSVQQYAQACKFAHSQSGSKYGENLYAMSGPGDVLASAVRAWMAEASSYQYNQPGFSAATGHFTQVVWKGTTQVACGVAVCPPGSILPQPTQYVVCRYSPPGNFQGQFPQNVGRPV